MSHSISIIASAKSHTRSKSSCTKVLVCFLIDSHETRSCYNNLALFLSMKVIIVMLLRKAGHDSQEKQKQPYMYLLSEASLGTSVLLNPRKHHSEAYDTCLEMNDVAVTVVTDRYTHRHTCRHRNAFVTWRK